MGGFIFKSFKYARSLGFLLKGEGPSSSAFLIVFSYYWLVGIELLGCLKQVDLGAQLIGQNTPH